MEKGREENGMEWRKVRMCVFIKRDGLRERERELERDRDRVLQRPAEKRREERRDALLEPVD